MVVTRRRSLLQTGLSASHEQDLGHPRSPDQGNTSGQAPVEVAVMQGSEHPCSEDPGLDYSGSSGSEDEGPDFVATADARERADQQTTAEMAADAQRKAFRAARGKAKEAAARLRKEARKKRQEEKGRVGPLERMLPEGVLERAANAVEEEHAREQSRAITKSLREQSGTLRLAARKRVVDGLEIVDARLPAVERVREKKKNRAVSFLNRCMYRTGPPRVAARAVQTQGPRRPFRRGGIQKRHRS